MMRAISLTQPWCGLMAAGIKRIENRNTPIVAAKDFGTSFGLHATREIDLSVFARIRDIAPELFTAEGMALDHWYEKTITKSAIIAVCSIVDCIRASGFNDLTERYTYSKDDLKRVTEDQHRWMFGRYCYVFAPDPIVLPVAVSCRGFQSFWKMTDDTERLVRTQLAEAA